MRLSSRALAEYARSAAFDDLPDNVVAQAAKLTLDALGCTVGAFPSPPSKVIREVYGDRDGDATLIGTRDRLPVEYAALANATMVRYLDFNDCYTTGQSACHPSDHIPALISVAEAEGASGRELVAAITLAFEVQCRGVDTGRCWTRGFDYVTWGAHAAALAAGRLMDLTEDQLVDALGIAAASSNALLISRLGEVSMWKAVAQPYATHNAIQACQLARAGMTGPEKVFEGVEERGGEGGFFDAVSGGPVDIEDPAGRGGGYRIMETSFKAFACGYFTHPSITAVLDIVRDHDLAPGDLEVIDVETFEHAIQVYASGPEKWGRGDTWNRETADHSLPYNVSVAVHDDEVTPRQYRSDRLHDDRVHALMSRVTATAADDLTAYRQANPRHVPARATIQTTDGDRFETRVNYPIGHPERPMSMDRVEEKFRGLAADALTDAQRDAAVAACRDLAEQPDMTALVDPLVI